MAISARCSARGRPSGGKHRGGRPERRRCTRPRRRCRRVSGCWSCSSPIADGFFFMMLDDPVGGRDCGTKRRPSTGIRAPTDIRVNEAMAASRTRRKNCLVARLRSSSPTIQRGPCALARVLRRQAGCTSRRQRRLDGTPIWIEGDYICSMARRRIWGPSAFKRDITRAGGPMSAALLRGKFRQGVPVARCGVARQLAEGRFPRGQRRFLRDPWVHPRKVIGRPRPSSGLWANPADRRRLSRHRAGRDGALSSSIRPT